MKLGFKVPKRSLNVEYCKMHFGSLITLYFDHMYKCVHFELCIRHSKVVHFYRVRVCASVFSLVR